MAQPLVPDDFSVPEHLLGAGFRLEVLGPDDNDHDHDAWMSSIDHIRATPGFPDGSWPSPMSLQDNLADLVNAHDTIEGDLRYQLDELRRAGINEVIMVDLSRRGLEVPVVKAVVPGLEGADKSAHYTRGQRAKQVANRQ